MDVLLSSFSESYLATRDEIVNPNNREKVKRVIVGKVMAEALSKPMPEYIESVTISWKKSDVYSICATRLDGKSVCGDLNLEYDNLVQKCRDL